MPAAKVLNKSIYVKLNVFFVCLVGWLVVFVQATEVKVNEVEFNPQFVSRMIPKLEWSALVQAAEEVSLTALETVDTRF